MIWCCSKKCFKFVWFGLDPNSLSSVLYREPAIPSYWCTVKAPSLSDFVSSLGKKKASLRSTNPSQTDFAADSMASDAEAFILSQSSDSAPWFATGYDLKSKSIYLWVACFLQRASSSSPRKMGIIIFISFSGELLPIDYACRVFTPTFYSSCPSSS